MNNINCKIVVDDQINRYSHIDVLVNNASKQAQCENFEDIDLGIPQATAPINLGATLYCA